LGLGSSQGFSLGFSLSFSLGLSTWFGLDANLSLGVGCGGAETFPNFPSLSPRPHQPYPIPRPNNQNAYKKQSSFQAEVPD
jgi:hypothetical protein